MGKKSGGSPDTVGAARVQGEMNRETARDATYADRPDQINPWAETKWGQEQVKDPATGEWVTKWTQSVGLSDETQRLYDDQMALQGGRGEMAAGMNDRIASEMGGAPDWAQFGDVQGLDYDPTAIRGAAEDAAYQRETMRLDPRFESEMAAMESKLANQGLRPGDQAYDSAMGTFNMGKDDAYERARLGATSTGMQEANQLWNQQMGSTQLANSLRSQQIQEYTGKRNYSLGEQNALNQGGDLSSLANIASGA
jgi:hypothetical protein